MSSPIRQIWEKLPSKLRTTVSTSIKAILTVLAFYLLLIHQVQVIDERPIEYSNGETAVIHSGQEIYIGSQKAVMKTAEKAVTENGENIQLREGMWVKYPDEDVTFKLLPLEKKTTFRAIIDYLPKINASTFWIFVLLAISIKGLGILCSMYRWHLLLQGQGIRFPFWHLVGSFLIGRFLGTFLPSTIGLDGYKLYDATRFSKRVVEATAATVIEKILGILGIFITFLVALPFGFRILEEKLKENTFLVTSLSVIFSLSIISVFFLLLFFPGIIQWFISHLPIPGKTKIQGFIQRVSKSAAAYRSNKLILVN
ncbi:flippase-like domain-containing protein, partial [bacterium]|nr:flippase-like domain-containing protein [candidate division CSSED10-310 bacterium]